MVLVKCAIVTFFSFSENWQKGGHARRRQLRRNDASMLGEADFIGKFMRLLWQQWISLFFSFLFYWCIIILCLSLTPPLWCCTSKVKVSSSTVELWDRHWSETSWLSSTFNERKIESKSKRSWARVIRKVEKS